MKKLNWDLRQLVTRNRDGAYGTQAGRWEMLDLIGRQLDGELGFKNMRKTSLKERHVTALIGLWWQQGLTIGTLKNRLSALRWWAEHIGQPGIIPKDNVALGIPHRSYVTNTSKAQELDQERLAKVTDVHVRMSLELQAAFGLRRDEALLLRPRTADQGDHLKLQGPWTKGGRPREVPIRHEAQREVLNRAHALAGKGSLIPAARDLKQQRNVYKGQLQKAGLHQMHGLRHAYAQTRYVELTGWECPARGGPVFAELTPEQKRQDKAARLQVSMDLGHERSPITSAYLGR